MENVTRFFAQKLQFLVNRPPILCNDTSTVPQQKVAVKFHRDAPPSDYSFKIGSFSSISKLKRQFSTVFEKGGYKWKLCFYPDGKKEEGGEGHISIYLVITDTESIPPGWEVKAFFRLLLFNQIRGTYLTLGVSHEKSFHAQNKEQGFAQFIRLKTFKEPYKGYLVNDACVIGAEVFVIKNKGKGDCYHKIRGVIPYKRTWKIKDFSELNKDTDCSHVFTIGKYEWKIKLDIPEGTAEGQQRRNRVSIVLELTNSDTLYPGQQVYVDYTLCLKGQADNSITERDQNWFSASQNSFGFKFVSLDKLKDPEEHYLVEDVCTIEANVTVLGLANTMP